MDLLEKQMKELQQSTQVMLGRTKNILVHNLAEPLIRDARARKDADRQHVLSVFRLAGISPTTPYTKCHRVGTWKSTHIAQPRPLLVVFTSTHTRDLLLSRAYMVQVNTGGCVKITPDEGLKKQTEVSSVMGHKTTNRGEPKVRLDRITSTSKMDLPKGEGKNQQHIPHMSRVRGSPISESTPQNKEPREKHGKKHKWGPSEGSPKKEETAVEVTKPIVSQQTMTPKRGLSSKVEDSGKAEKMEPVNQDLVPQSWAKIAAAAPKIGQTYQKITKVRDSTSLNMSESFPVAFSNMEMTNGGMSWTAHHPAEGSKTGKNGVHPRVLRPRVPNC